MSSLGRKGAPCLAAWLAVLGAVSARAEDGALARVRAYRAAHEREILGDLTDLLALPNVASDLAATRRNAEAIARRLDARGLSPELLELEDRSAPPLVTGVWDVGAARTLVFYAHYDGQPVVPEDWASDPWVPTWRAGALSAGARTVALPEAGPIDPEWRLYARSASDDKAGVVAILTAVDALRSAGLRPRVNLRFAFEGEEEAGSPHLRALLERNRSRFGSATWIVCDGPVHASGAKQVVFGVRGVVQVGLTVYGARRPLHSGHYGNWAPNPALRLAELLASLKDDAGRVAVAGWYDDVAPLGDEERRAIAEAPRADAQLLRELGLAEPEQPGLSLLEAISLPSLNVAGLRAADVGARASNIIPATASAALDLRLVKGNLPERQVERLRDHVRRQGYLVLDREPTDAERLSHARIASLRVAPGGYAASRTPMDSEVARAVIQAVQATTAEPIVRLPTLGGSLPLAAIREGLGADAIVVPIANPDNNQHAENENLRLQNLWDGVETMASVMLLPE